MVDADGAPVPGVAVRLFRHVQSVRHGERSLLSRVARGEHTVSGPDGRFRLYGVPLEGAFLDLFGTAIVPWVQALDGDALPAEGDPLVITVARSARLAVRLVEPGEADAFEVLDEDGEPLPLFLKRTGLGRLRHRAPLVGGSSEVLRVPARATSIRLLSGGQPVRVEPLQLAAGQRALVEL